MDGVEVTITYYGFVVVKGRNGEWMEPEFSAHYFANENERNLMATMFIANSETDNIQLYEFEYDKIIVV